MAVEAYEYAVYGLLLVVALANIIVPGLFLWHNAAALEVPLRKNIAMGLVCIGVISLTSIAIQLVPVTKNSAEQRMYNTVTFGISQVIAEGFFALLFMYLYMSIKAVLEVLRMQGTVDVQAKLSKLKLVLTVSLICYVVADIVGFVLAVVMDRTIYRNIANVLFSGVAAVGLTVVIRLRSFFKKWIGVESQSPAVLQWVRVAQRIMVAEVLAILLGIYAVVATLDPTAKFIVPSITLLLNFIVSAAITSVVSFSFCWPVYAAARITRGSRSSSRAAKNKIGRTNSSQPGSFGPDKASWVSSVPPSSNPTNYCASEATGTTRSSANAV